MKNNIHTLTAVLSLVVLSGCAQQPTSTEAARTEEKAATQAAVASAKAETAAKQAALPATISFAATSTKLDQQSLDVIAEAAKQIPATAKIVVTGYADRKLGNTKNRALARGIAVKAALVKNGIAAKSIRVKYVTGEPRNEATIVVAD